MEAGPALMRLRILWPERLLGRSREQAASALPLLLLGWQLDSRAETHIVIAGCTPAAELDVVRARLDAVNAQAASRAGPQLAVLGVLNADAKGKGRELDPDAFSPATCWLTASPGAVAGDRLPIIHG